MPGHDLIGAGTYEHTRHRPGLGLMALDYIKIQGDVLISHGPDAAILLALVSFRAYQDQGWVGTYSDIEADIGLTPRRIRVAASVLREAGLLDTTAAGRGRTLHWWPKGQSVSFKRSKRHLDTVYRETKITNTADAGSEADDMADAEATPIDGGLFPSEAVPRQEPTPDEWLNECRKVWISSFTAARGHAPNPATANKAFGSIKAAGRHQASMDDWRDLWRACRSRGSQGLWSIEVDEPMPRNTGRGNRYVSVVQADATAALGILGIDPRELGS